MLASDITSRVRSKEDLHFILSVEGQFHIPTLDEISMFYLKEVLAGRKLLLKLVDIRPVMVPRLREFSADVLYKEVMLDETLQQYFPDPNEKNRRPVSRRFLFNVSPLQQLGPCISLGYQYAQTRVLRGLNQLGFRLALRQEAPGQRGLHRNPAGHARLDFEQPAQVEK